MQLQAVMRNRVFLGMLAWATFHVRLALLVWLIPRVAPPVLETLGLPQAERDPFADVVRFRFSPLTADVAEASRVDTPPDPPIQGRFNSEARDEVVDDRDTPVPATDVTGPDNSIAGTGADEASPGDPGAAEATAVTDAREGAPEPVAAASMSAAPPSLEAGRELSASMRERLPASAQEMLTGQRARPQSPGHGERVSPEFEERGARTFGAFSFSTDAWEFEPYWHHMRRKLYGAWHPPAAWLTYGIVSDGWTVVRAIIDKDGRLTEATIVETFGHESLHNASRAAMVGAAPFKALPSDFPDEKLIVYVRFEYGGGRPNPEQAP